MDKKIIRTEKAPAPIGPYSQAVQAGPFLFASGQIAINPASGQLVNNSIEAETEQVMANIESILLAAGLRFSNVVKTTIFLKDLGNFEKVNKIYGNFFTGEYPARETVEVSRLPKDVNVEISVTALRV